ncbi:MAG: CoA ester lyase [Candidatus Thermoplasmatota archaeon]|nr:CoA ester lyase [Candidatus Thermoplasmatota archaeon]MDD5778649.1 CoA ester lyase [Candidatus Thermoplasmatota archaeon]
MVYTLRRSRIYVPGNNPRMLSTCDLFGADAVTLDIEDAVAPEQKLSARWLIAEALRDQPFGNSEVTVRINALSTHWGHRDLEAVIPTGRVEVIYLPKAESARDVQELDRVLTELEEEHGLESGQTKIIPLVESARGILFAHDIATASHRIVALSFGGEDYTRDVGGEKTDTEEELAWPRSALVAAAKAAGVQALDTVYSNVDDLDGLYRQAVKMRQLGFDGKAAVHPNQVEVIHRAFSPSPEEIDYALQVMQAIEEAEAGGSGVIALGRKMIDKPVVARAERTLMIAALSGLIARDKLPERIREVL